MANDNKMSTESQILYDMIKEIRQEQRDANKVYTDHQEQMGKFATNMYHMQGDVAEIKRDVKRNADNLEAHMRRTDVLEKLHEDNQGRIQRLESFKDTQIEAITGRLNKLEEPVKAKKWLTTNYLTVTSMFFALLSIVALILQIKG